MYNTQQELFTESYTHDSFPWMTYHLSSDDNLFEFFFLIKKNNIYVSVQKVVCGSHQSDRLGYVSRTNQIAALRYVSRTNQIVVFVLWFERYSNFNELTGNSERTVRKMESSFRMKNVGFSVFLQWLKRPTVQFNFSQSGFISSQSSFVFSQSSLFFSQSSFIFSTI